VNTNQRTVRVLLRVLLFLVPVMALVVLGFAGVSFLTAQLSDLPQGTQTEMLKPAAEKPAGERPRTPRPPRPKPAETKAEPPKPPAQS
jgi:hypothetical protein